MFSMSREVIVLSLKGGTGKTTTTESTEENLWWTIVNNPMDCVTTNILADR